MSVKGVRVTILNKFSKLPCISTYSEDHQIEFIVIKTRVVGQYYLLFKDLSGLDFRVHTSEELKEMFPNIDLKLLD